VQPGRTTLIKRGRVVVTHTGPDGMTAAGATYTVTDLTGESLRRLARWLMTHAKEETNAAREGTG
jgi:hypothetical protein